MSRLEGVDLPRQQNRKRKLAKWPCPGGRIMGEAVFPALPRSWNEILAMRARERMRTRREDKARWHVLLLTAEGRKLPRGVRGVEIHITCQGPRRRDPDNLFVKPLIDAMRAAGILPDDDSDHVTAVRLEYHGKKGVPVETAIRLVDAPAQ